jgi:hypothetical protein
MHPVDEDPVEALRAFEEGLTVRLISTPRERMKTCHGDEDLAAVIARNSADRFDFLPVTTDSPGASNLPDRIVGVVGKRWLR